MDFNLTTSKPSDSEHVKVLIIGSGPAGLSAALYAARAEMDPVVLTGMELGGQVSLTYTVENYPGFPEGVGGTQLVELFQKQAERFGARVEFDTATEIDFSQRPFRVRYPAFSVVGMLPRIAMVKHQPAQAICRPFTTGGCFYSRIT